MTGASKAAVPAAAPDAPCGLVARLARLPWSDALGNWIRGFYLGYGFEVGPGVLRILITVLVIAVQRLMGRQPGKASSIGRLLRHELNSVLRREAVPFAVFVGAFASSYPLLRALLADALGPRRRQWAPALAGAAAATAIVLDTSKGARDRRTVFALYMMVRAAESAATSLVAHGKVPYFAHMDTLLFQLSCLEIMYSWFYTPETLPREYVGWISRMANMDQRLIEFLRAYREGRIRYGVHNDMLDAYCRDNHLPTHMGDTLYGFLSCEIVHPHDPYSCLGNARTRWVTGFKQALLLYLPVHILPSLLFRPQSFTSNPASFILHNILSASRYGAMPVMSRRVLGT